MEIHFRNNKTEKEMHRKMFLTWDQKLGLVKNRQLFLPAEPLNDARHLVQLSYIGY